MTPLEINKKIASMRAHDGIDNDHPFSAKKNRRYCWAQLIDDAWELFEEMVTSQQGWRAVVLSGNDSTFLPRYKVLIKDHDAHNRDECEASADTVPMAICLAWIKWKEQK